MDNIYSLFSKIFRQLDTIENKIDLSRKGKKDDLHDEFNVIGLNPASKILGYKSTKTLKNKIEKGDILKKNIHYRIDGSGRYFFSKGALLSVKGLI